jgi:LEA14-like dessication related protein
MNADVFVRSASNAPRDLRRRHLLRAAVLTVTAVTAVACSSVDSLEPLEVTLTNISVPEITVFETTLVAKLRITNPNPEGFTIDGASFKLYLEDKKVGTGTTSETFTVDRLDSTVVDAVFHLNNASALLRLRDILEGDDEVTYGVRGSLFVQGKFGTKKMKIEKMGRIDLKEMKSPDSDGPNRVDTPPRGEPRR